MNRFFRTIKIEHLVACLSAFAIPGLQISSADSIDSFKQPADSNYRIETDSSGSASRFSPFLQEKIKGKALKDTVEVRIWFAHAIFGEPDKSSMKRVARETQLNSLEIGVAELENALGREMNFSGSFISGIRIRLSITEIMKLEKLFVVEHMEPVVKIPPELHIGSPSKRKPD